MTYIIGGTPRSGKSTIQNIFLNKHKIPGISTDLLREAFEYGVPSFGITPQMNDSFLKSEILWPYFKGLLIARDAYETDLLIEGTNFLPKYLAEFKNDSKIKMCFLGYSEVGVEEKFKSIRKNSEYDDDWTKEESDESLMNLVEEFIDTSRYFKEECKKYDIEYFDTSKDFNEVIEQACKYLLEKSI